MAIKLKIPRAQGSKAMLRSPIVRAVVAACLIICQVFFGIFSYYYIK